MAKKIVVTSRGTKLDFDALKAAQPNVKPVVARKIKPNTNKSIIQKVVKSRVGRLTAETVAPRPIHVEEVSVNLSTTQKLPSKPIVVPKVPKKSTEELLTELEKHQGK